MGLPLKSVSGMYVYVCIIISLLMSPLLGTGLPYGLHIRVIVHHAGPVRVGGFMTQLCFIYDHICSLGELDDDLETMS
jgi:hypothetical protein